MPTSLQANRTLANPAAGAGSITAIEQFAQNNPALYAQMTALEQFNGQTILDKWVRSSGSSFVVSYSAEQAVLINQAYDALKDSVYVALVVQTRLKPYLDSIDLMVDEAGVHFDTTALASKVDAAITSDSRNGITDLIELNLFANSTLREVGFDGIATLRAQIAALPANSPVLAELTSLHVLRGTATGTDNHEVYLGDAGNNSFNGGGGDDVIDGRMATTLSVAQRAPMCSVVESVTTRSRVVAVTTCSMAAPSTTSWPAACMTPGTATTTERATTPTCSAGATAKTAFTTTTARQATWTSSSSRPVCCRPMC
ncbi:hypothetical protein WKW82_23710 [Variovorax rhizosphaerae]|uniref:Calcium-binding protein n=1 Tax=Variovorax rhizosphaerae TaxID=1836200 RepID=A0ABU8WQ68_9BURK